MQTSSALEQPLEILRQLVAFPTVSSESNLALIAWVEEYLDGLGIPHWRINESSHKASLLARVGPEVEGGIVLSGHTDVVPVKDQPWYSDPFTLSQRDGRLFGRGTADMKSFLALALAAAPHWQQLPLRKPIWLAFSHDEEIGCLGAAPMATAWQAMQVHPLLVVVGEPTSMQLVGAHKGIQSFETIVTGREAHSSMPEQGTNAVMIAAELVHTLTQLAEQQRACPVSDSGFPSPYSTVHVGTIEGGTARNIIPRHARFCWEVRPLPGVDVDALLAPFHTRVAELQSLMGTRHTGTGIVTRPISQVLGLAPLAADDPALPVACQLAQVNQPLAVSYGTEAGIFQSHGFSTVICGPGSIDQAHQPDEWISLDQLVAGADFMQRLGAWATH